MSNFVDDFKYQKRVYGWSNLLFNVIWILSAMFFSVAIVYSFLR